MRLSTQDLLLLHSAVIGVILFISWRVLRQKDLFHLTTAGFWAWFAFGLYFLLNPLVSVWWNLGRYEMVLGLSGGIERGQWITFVTAVGLIVFFVAYVRSQPRLISWNLDPVDQRFSFPMVLVLLIVCSFAIYSLLVYRLRTVYDTGASVAIESGRFIGETTGYEYRGHVFLFIPITLLILSRSRLKQRIGWLASLAYIVISLFDPSARLFIVSMVLTLLMADAIRRSPARPKPRLVLIVIAILLSGVLQLRGHDSLESSTQFYELIAQVPVKMFEILASVDVSMLATWYLESYVKDTITGYDFGIPLLNYVLLGWIPFNIFPYKYFLVDWLRDLQPLIYDSTIIYLLYGSKSSLVGSFYTNGGLIGVVVQMWFAGILSRKLDSMVLAGTPLLVQATGVAWMGSLWMVWGSHDSWGINLLGTLLMPALALWLVSPKVSSKCKKVRRTGRISRALIYFRPGFPDYHRISSQDN